MTKDDEIRFGHSDGMTSLSPTPKSGGDSSSVTSRSDANDPRPLVKEDSAAAPSDDPLWDDICETLLSLAKTPRVPRPRTLPPRRDARRRSVREATYHQPPGPGTGAARALAAFVPGAWLSMRDVRVRVGARPWLVASNLYARLWRKGWVEQIDDPDAEGRPCPGKGPRGPRKLWRLTALGEAVRVAVLEGAAEIGPVEERAPVGLAENPWRRRPSAIRRRRRAIARRKRLESRA